MTHGALLAIVEQLKPEDLQYLERFISAVGFPIFITIVLLVGFALAAWFVVRPLTQRFIEFLDKISASVDRLVEIMYRFDHRLSRIEDHLDLEDDDQSPEHIWPKP